MGDTEKEFLRFFSPVISELRVLRALQREVSAYLNGPGMTPLETLMEVRRRRESQEEGQEVSRVNLDNSEPDPR